MPDFEKNILLALGLSLTFVLSLVIFFIRRIYIEHRKLLLVQRDMLRNEVRSREVERQRIGEDLHDELGPTLSYARMILSQIQPDDPVQMDAKNRVESALQEGLTAVRTMSFGLVPPDFAGKTLEQAINTLCERLLEPKSIHYKVFVDDKANGLSVENRLHLYRIIQELTHNSVRHSGCDSVDISLKVTAEGESMELKYSDNGRGLDKEKNNIASGIGMSNIRNRASLLRGAIHFPAQERGFCFLLNFPLQNSNG